MAFRLSTGLRNALMGAGLKGLLNGGFMEIYSGYQPDSADMIETSGAVLLAVISSTSGTSATDGLQFGTAASGVLPIAASPVWSGVVLVDGVAGWFRFHGSGGIVHGSNGTAIRFDGAVGVSGADLNLSHTSLTQASTLTVTAFNITEPAS